MSNLLARLMVGLILLASPVLGCPLQKEKGQFLLPIPEKLERAVVADDQGVQNWVPFKAEPCVNCKGKKTMTCLHCARVDEKDTGAQCPECNRTKTATCRVCGGSGEAWDILQKAPCPTCFGAAVTACFICNGEGQIHIEGGGPKPAKCGSCDGLGGYKCQTCGGKRFVELPVMKPAVTDGKVQDIKKAMDALAAVAAGLEKFESAGDGRKDIKLYQTLLAPGGKFFPPLARTSKHLEDVSKKQTKGALWKAYSDMVKNQAAAAKQALEYYLKHQKRVLELCLARAEHNEPLLAAKKK